MYPYASSFDQTAEKLEYDMYYLKNMSFALGCGYTFEDDQGGVDGEGEVIKSRPQ